MPNHLQRQIELVKRKTLFVGSTVERAIDIAVAALAERDEPLAAKALEEHARIDRMEVNIGTEKGTFYFSVLEKSRMSPKHTHRPRRRFPVA